MLLDHRPESLNYKNMSTESLPAPKELDVEAREHEQSPDEQEGMEGSRTGDASAPAFDFEVKEQDRWLPIANGECLFISFPFDTVWR